MTRKAIDFPSPARKVLFGLEGALLSQMCFLEKEQRSSPCPDPILDLLPKGGDIAEDEGQSFMSEFAVAFWPEIAPLQLECLQQVRPVAP